MCIDFGARFLNICVILSSGMLFGPEHKRGEPDPTNRDTKRLSLQVMDLPITIPVACLIFAHMSDMAVGGSFSKNQDENVPARSGGGN